MRDYKRFVNAILENPLLRSSEIVEEFIIKEQNEFSILKLKYKNIKKLVEMKNFISLNGELDATFYQNKKFTVLQDAYAINWIFDNRVLSDNHYLFLVSSISKVIYGNYEWTNKAGWERIKTEKIELPIKKDNSIDYDFMESFIAELEAERVAELEAERVAELEAYLNASGLKNYELTKAEEQILSSFSQIQNTFKAYRFDVIFNNIKQGRRLRKEDQLPGDIPFVMSGVTGNGVVGYISNPVASFPSNSITLDIFGNGFYRSYEFGAGDDTGVYWNDKSSYSKNSMLFFTAAMRASLKGKFSFGKKLRSSQSKCFKMMLPTKNGKLDKKTMDLLISAIQKLVIKDVVLYADEKIAKTKQIVDNTNK